MSPLLSSSPGAYSAYAVSAAHVPLPLPAMPTPSPRGVKRSRSPDVRYDQTGADVDDGTSHTRAPTSPGRES
jgi:hypothetical protein